MPIRPALATLALAALALAPASAPAAARSAPQEPPPPARLAVLVCCQRLLPEHLERLGPELTGGLARLRREGRLHLAAELGSAWSDDAAAAATLVTGTLPRRHGIVGDAFRPTPEAELQPAARDATTALLAPGPPFTSPEPGGSSPALLGARDVGARLVAAVPGARVLAVGGDVDVTVLLGGRAAAWAIWWDRRAGGFTSSTRYGPELPAAVLAWNRGWVARARGHAFTPQLADPAALGFGPDDRPGELPSSNAGALLPLTLPDPGEDPSPIERQLLANALRATPLLDTFCVDLALALVESSQLGADDACDLLALDLSALGQAVRRSGPDGVEAAETVLALDRELGRLFDALDARLGADAWVAVVAGTVGCTELPEALAARGVGARRLFSNETRRTLAHVREALDGHFGAHFGAALFGRELELDEAALAASGADPAEVRRVARTALLQSADWCAGAYTREELLGPPPELPDPWLELHRRSFAPGRAPDVALRLQPWTLYGRNAGTDAGSPYPWDRRTVLGFLGPGFGGGTTYAPAGLEDAAPTLLVRLGLDFAAGELDGRALR